MTLVTLANDLMYPTWQCGGNVQDLTLDAAGEYDSVIVRAREDMVISHVAWQVTNVSGSPTGTVRIESVDEDTGIPTGTLWGTNTNIVTGTLTNGTRLDALTASATISQGDVFAVKFGYISGTSFRVQGRDIGASQGQFPYRVNNTGTPTKQNWQRTPIMALGSSSTVFYRRTRTYPPSAIFEPEFNPTDDLTHEHGMRFSLPFPCRCTGMLFVPQNHTGDFNINLYNDAGTLLSTGEHSGHQSFQANNQSLMHELHFDDSIALAKDTFYRIAVEAIEASVDVRVVGHTLASANYMMATPWGAGNHATSFNGTVWDDANTSRQLIMGIIIDQLDDGAGAGGGETSGVFG